MNSAQWWDRIVSLERIPSSQLQSHAGNWRLHPAHQQQALAGILEEIGQAAALLVYHSDRQGGMCIIDGHLRSSLDPHASWPCLVLDVTDQEANLLAATLYRLAAMAERDERQLAALLGGLAVRQCSGGRAVTRTCYGRADRQGGWRGYTPAAVRRWRATRAFLDCAAALGLRQFEVVDRPMWRKQNTVRRRSRRRTLDCGSGNRNRQDGERAKSGAWLRFMSPFPCDLTAAAGAGRCKIWAR